MEANTAGAKVGLMDTRNLLLWAIVTAITTAIALINTSSVFTPLGVVPFGNDGFYHAARILDASIGERGFYQFDDMIHAPEGSWVTWPWAYDYLLSRLVIVQQAIFPGADPVAMLVYIPVLWIGVNVALLLAICARLELRMEFRALAVLGFAFLPTTQSQHAIGQIDHHFIELFFVLLSTWLAMSWLKHEASVKWAIACGAALGLSQAFHHALFILQLPLLIAIGVLWFKGLMPPTSAVRALAATLLVSTLFVAFPSGPFRDMQFSMTLLSWFHVYIAACTSGVLLALTLRPFTLPVAGALGVAGLLLLIPISAELNRGADFVAGRMAMLEEILEMKSPLAMIVGDFGLNAVLGIYGLFIVLVPFLIAFCLWRLWVEKSALRIAYLSFATIGMLLMLMQYRLNYFGAMFMLTAPWFAIGFIPAFQRLKQPILLGGSVIFFLLAFRPTLTGALFNEYPIAGNVLYETVQPLMPSLARACEEDPGIVLAAGQFGHYITFHTECSVIVNNFLITDLHYLKVREVNELFSVPAELLARGGGPIKYILAMSADTHAVVDGVTVLKDLSNIEQRNPALIRDLLFASDKPDNVATLKEVKLQLDDGSLLPLAGVYKITPP